MQHPIQRPLVSVVIGSYNRRTFLECAIDSVRADDAGVGYELIVVDGGSTDGSLEWLVAQKDIVTIVQHNRGEFRGRPIRRRSWGYFMNLGFKAAQGRYVMMLSDDCLLVPGATARGIARFDQDSEDGRPIGAVAYYFRNWPHEQEYYVQRTLGGKLMVNHGMYRRDVLEQVGWVDEDRYLFYKADGDLSLKIWEAGYGIVDCPGAFVEHFEGANRAVRKSNREVLVRDREAYRQRWSGMYWDPDGPDLRDRVTLAYEDPHRTALRFPKDSPRLVERLRQRGRRVAERVRVRLAGAAHA